MIIKQPPRLTNRAGFMRYIEGDLWTWLKSISVAFLKMNFQDNFQSFTVSNLIVPANTEIAISNQLQSKYAGIIPTGYLITRQKGDANIIDGDTPWSETIVYLKNPSLNNAIITVIFFI